MSLESFVLDIIEERKNAPGLRKLLRLFSFGYQAAVSARNFFYDKSWLKTHDVPLCVVSIGNIVTGGTGKTPLIQYMAEEITKAKKVAIVTRGYRSQIEKTKATVRISEGTGPTVSVKECGDEAFWLALHTKASVWVGKNKLQSAQEAYQNGAEVVLIDDGMQHRRLKRDIEIVAIDARDPFGKGFYLPRGFLRDSPERLKKADLIVVNHLTEGSLEEVEKKLRQFSEAPLVGTRLHYELDEKWKGKKVGVFCGIAKPHHFYDAVQKAGSVIVDHLFTLDHIVPSFDELAKFAEKCKEKGAAALICTEKDLVKLENFFNMPLPIAALTMKLEIVEGKQYWKEIIEKITGKKQ